MKIFLIPPPIQGLLCAAFMWGISSLLPSLSYTFSGQKPLGLIIIVLGLTIDVVSVLKFKQSRTTINPIKIEKASSLVTSGLYTVSRNPMYLGLAIILLGWAILLGNPLNVVTLGLFVFLITKLQIIPEEHILLGKFGAPYSDYLNTVRRWI